MNLLRMRIGRYNWLFFFFSNLELTKKFSFAFWIGLNTLNFNSGWQWAGGSPFRYLNWAPGKNCIYFVIFEWFLIRHQLIKTALTTFISRKPFWFRIAEDLDLYFKKYTSKWQSSLWISAIASSFIFLHNQRACLWKQSIIWGVI